MTRGEQVVVTRGEGVDAVHRAAVAVVGASGALTHFAGDPELVVFARSSIKPLQALSLVRSGAIARLHLTDEELAIACASHSGTDRHVAIVERLLERTGASVSDLGCGSHWPIGMRLENRYPTAGEDRDPLRHNCSGKHAGFLAACRALGAPFATYLEPSSPVQRLVREAVAEACEVEPESMLTGTDGCSAPNYALPLVALARGARALAVAEAGDALGLAPLRRAMLSHSLLVSGEGRLDRDLSLAFPANAVAKGGAEAVQLIGFAEPALGIALKVLDGATRALGPVVVAVLRSLGLLAGDDARLATYATPPVTNARGLVTGRIVSTLELERAGNGGDRSDRA